MPFPRRADPRRRRHGRLRVSAGLALIAASFLAPGLAGGEEAPIAPQAAPADACNGVLSTVEFIGSSSAREALIGWAPEVCDRFDVVPDYTDFGSEGGRAAVIPADAPVIGLTSLPFDEEEQAELIENERGIVLVPMLTTAVACTYWDTNPFAPATNGTRFPDLRISRRTLADFSGGSPRDGTNVAQDLIDDNADNPAFRAGPPFLNVEVWFRSGPSAVTHRLTEWFGESESATEDFTKGAFEGYELPFEDIGTPDGSSPSLINDYTTMKSRMFTALQNLGLGCMDNATARTDAQPETEKIDALNIAWLDNAAGEFVAPTDEAVANAAAAMTPNADGTFAVDWEHDDPEAYALPLVVYAAMPTCGIDAATRTNMDRAMTYLVGDGQQVLPEGNVPMPKNLTDVATKQLATWRTASRAEPCDGPVPTTTTTSTTTTVPGATTVPEAPTTVPFVDPGSDFVPTGSSGGGVLSDPSIGGSAGGSSGGVDAGAGAGGADGGAEAGGGSAGAGDGGGEGADAGLAAPLAAVVAVASGAQAVPPAALLLGGSSLLIAGPALQVAGGLRRTGSFPSTVRSWFSRLKP
jgi:hypothetical protein